MTQDTTARWAARCECYNDHNSTSGRCNVRDVSDPTAKPGEAVVCERCRKECLVERLGRLCSYNARLGEVRP